MEGGVTGSEDKAIPTLFLKGKLGIGGMDAVGEKLLDGDGDSVVSGTTTLFEFFHPNCAFSRVFNKADVGAISRFGGFAGYFHYLQADGIEEVTAQLGGSIGGGDGGESPMAFDFGGDGLFLASVA